jgi:hypothetical protein
MGVANDNGQEKTITVRCNRLTFGHLPIFTDEKLGMSFYPPVFTVDAATVEGVSQGISNSITEFTKRCQHGDNLYAAISNVTEVEPGRFAVEVALLAQASDLVFSSKEKKE